jgi:hypothetical protein
MRIIKKWQSVLAGALLLAVCTSGSAISLKADENTVVRPNGKGRGVVDENATRVARLYSQGQPVRGKKNGPIGIYPFWQPNTLYTAGDVVSYNGFDYKALVNQTDYAGTGQNPTVATLWKRLERDNKRNNGIFYHGGRVMNAPISVYYIWYGNWSPYAKTQTILRTFMNSVGNTPAWNVNTTYYDSNDAHVSRHISLGGEISDNYSQGRAFNDDSAGNVVTRALKSGAVPLSGDAIYMVFTSPDVPAPGFGDIYCGLHNSFMYGGVDVKYAFIGNPITIAPSACGVRTPSPNNDAGGDAMVTVMFHELGEIVTDPDLNAWFDDSIPLPVPTENNECSPNGYEAGDKCVWQFGTTQRDANGAEYNHTIAGNNYLLQEMWLNARGGLCVQRQ